MHTLGKIHAVEHLDLIPLPLLQEVAHLPQDAALTVYHHIRGMGLEQVGGEPKPGLAGAGRADDAAVEIAGVGRVFWAGVHGQVFSPGEDDVVLKRRVDEGFDVLFRPP